ncbi:hypothetical protein GCM10011507_35040 [Edaphobacter acidisoli]|uniref:Uncharacterized protein n=1 Tax=Edaphobacter acidisoli TaxID=2040573 RepID=A0A916WAA5_9BACT|nr:hypothetical protein [Edaphobacter acidisoli]GGA80819.1 hypothetical protein GCM10011507_35040 [Edaphobacter acidisoli]
MAAHLTDLKSSGIPSVTKDDFYRKYLQWGDLVFCCGQHPIARAIEGVTHSPLSHVLMAHLPYSQGPWMTLEATVTKGVHFGLLSDYTGFQDGTLILARRNLSFMQRLSMLDTMAGLIDDKYDWRQEVSIVANRLLHFLPVVHPQGELYCSGLIWAGARAIAPFAYQVDAAHPSYPTPEDIYTDPSVEAICMLEMPAA